jgi:hypothetical protein
MTVSEQIIQVLEMNGEVPGGMSLAKLHAFGGDVIYVLTGKRRAEDGK